jgi:hypothetical protein
MVSHKRDALLMVVLVWALAMPALSFAGFGSTALLAVLALPYVLVLPGYTFVTAVLPEHQFGTAERLLLSLGLSLVIVILGGLLLNLTPYGLQARSWSALLSGLMVCACVVAYLRQRRVRAPLAARPWVSVAPRTWLLWGLAAAIAAGSIVVSSISAQQQEAAKGYAVLWMLPANDGAGIEAAAQQGVRIGVQSMWPVTMTYSVDVSVSGQAIYGWESITLKPGERWEARLSVPSSKGTGRERVDAVLHLSTAPSAAYRHVVLWLGP